MTTESLDSAIARHLLVHPGDSLQRLALRLDAKPAAVGRGLTRLESKGIAKLNTVGRECYPVLTMFTALETLETAIRDLREAVASCPQPSCRKWRPQ